MTTILICWLVPIVIIVTLAGVLFSRNYRNSVQQEIDASTDYALRQVQMQLETAIGDSKAVSYDGIVRSAYRSYQQNSNIATLYRSVNDYLNQSFSRSDQYKAVFISFWEEEVNANAYLLNSGTNGYGLLQLCRESTPQILETMADTDTDICFLMLDGNLFMARNLLDSHFDPYASIVILLEPSAFFQPLNTISRVTDMQLFLDENRFSLDSQGTLTVPVEDSTGSDIRYSVEVDGHIFAFTAKLEPYNLWEDNPWLRWAVVIVALMVLPMLIFTVAMFHFHVSRPMEVLAQAHMQVQSGQRGFQINRGAPNSEFSRLYGQFNAMSTELKNQFEQSYLEQQATQRAQIKALQSQINPHFLNNTLEIINWEARLAENDRVSAMIEALSTMLDAALDRDGRTQIPLKEELGYVDAYLYIIRERLGENFHVHQDIDPAILPQLVPRLILQPIVENAVEHDITSRHGGNLWVRVYRQPEWMVLEVEHDGTMTAADRASIQALLSDTQTEGSQVGLRNVNRRLKLLYGDQGILTVGETDTGTILAKICFPIQPEI